METEPGGTREAARDIVNLYGNLAVVYPPAVTLGFARYLLAFAVERLNIVTGPGPAVPVAVHTSTGQKFGHYLGLAVRRQPPSFSWGLISGVTTRPFLFLVCDLAFGLLGVVDQVRGVTGEGDLDCDERVVSLGGGGLQVA